MKFRMLSLVMVFGSLLAVAASVQAQECKSVVVKVNGKEESQTFCKTGQTWRAVENDGQIVQKIAQTSETQTATPSEMQADTSTFQASRFPQGTVRFLLGNKIKAEDYYNYVVFASNTSPVFRRIALPSNKDSSNIVKAAHAKCRNLGMASRFVDKNDRIPTKGRPYNAPNPLNDIDFECAGNVSSMSELVVMIAEADRDIMCPVIEVPSRQISSISKGEFEKTVDFEKRRQADQEKLDADYQKAQSSYEKKKSDADACRAIDPKKWTEYYQRAAALAWYNNGNLGETKVSRWRAASIYAQLVGFVYDADAEAFKVDVRFRSEYLKRKGYLDPRMNRNSPNRYYIDENYTLTIPSAFSEAQNHKRILEQLKEGKTITPTFIIEANIDDLRIVGIEEIQSKAALASTEVAIKKQQQQEIAAAEAAAAKELREKKAQEAKDAQVAKVRQKSYQAQKRVGDEVCKDGSVDTQRGWVEKVTGTRIQIRSANYEATYLNGDLFWDSYNNWRHCN